jgi:hypothetical protein
MIDANECRENARRCVMLANQTTDALVKERLFETAQGWMRLAVDFANFDDQRAKQTLLDRSA